MACLSLGFGFGFKQYRPRDTVHCNVTPCRTPLLRASHLRLACPALHLPARPYRPPRPPPPPTPDRRWILRFPLHSRAALPIAPQNQRPGLKHRPIVSADPKPLLYVAPVTRYSLFIALRGLGPSQF